ncbi:hypothetical protein HPB50_016554 [Hyalomma asiaticum]|uniref:Uncharacterized protein n=1 Tax=Hyalomma asiaticum TaxID=266040 RepID=A0ACB7SX20_HYAAI|nr:hypothetical protein HPB50_016554 [Hyalomma asiaticum]
MAAYTCLRYRIFRAHNHRNSKSNKVENLCVAVVHGLGAAASPGERSHVWGRSDRIDARSGSVLKTSHGQQTARLPRSGNNHKYGTARSNTLGSSSGRSRGPRGHAWDTVRQRRLLLRGSATAEERVAQARCSNATAPRPASKNMSAATGLFREGETRCARASATHCTQDDGITAANGAAQWDLLRNEELAARLLSPGALITVLPTRPLAFAKDIE